MRILVTGGCGFIGSQICHDILNFFPESEIVVLDNLSSSSITSLFDLPNKAKFHFSQGDVTNKQDVMKLIKNVEIVIHLAALTDIESSLVNPRKYWETNYDGTKNVLDASVSAGVKWFVFPSTFNIYGRGMEESCSETSSVLVTNPYAYSKYKAEILCSNYKDNLGIIIHRLGACYGFSPGIRFNTPVNSFAKAVIIGEPVIILGDGSHSWPHIHIRDASAAILFTIQKMPELKQSQHTFNTGFENLTMNQLVDIVKREASKYLRIEPEKISVQHKNVDGIVSCKVDSSSLLNLGFRPKYTITDGLGELFEKSRQLRRLEI